MLWSRYVIGYHGCDTTLAEQVVCKKQKLNVSSNDYDWLGSGIYFWEGSQKRAVEWAVQAAADGNPKIKKPGVLGAVIDVGECLNLVEVEYLELVAKAYATMEELHKIAGTQLPQNVGKDLGARNLDRAVFEFLHSSRKEDNLHAFDTVRAFFIEGDALYPGSGIRGMDHIQICVRHPNQSIGFFLP